MQAANFYINLAIKQSLKAQQNCDIPIGAVCVVQNYPYKGVLTITTGYNKVYNGNCQSKHAEVIAIKKMTQKLGITNFNNIEATVYSTLEPCLMCYGFISLCKIQNIIFGIRDEKFGFINNTKQNPSGHNNYKPQYLYGFEEQKIHAIMQGFFKNKRKK